MAGKLMHTLRNTNKAAQKTRESLIEYLQKSKHSKFSKSEAHQFNINLVSGETMRKLFPKISIDAEIQRKRKESAEGNSTSLDSEMLELHQLNRAREEVDFLEVNTTVV